MEYFEFVRNEPIPEPVPRLHIFQRKIRRRFGAPFDRPFVGEGCIGVVEFERLHTAAFFAVQKGLPLDMLVTLDFDRLGIRDEEGARIELTRFLKNFNAWCAERRFPAMYAYCFESSRRGLGDTKIHAHIAVHVPPQLGLQPMPGHVATRTAFRSWAQAFGRHTPRAVRVSGGRNPSILGHWLAVTYLMKGFSFLEIVQSAERSPDGQTVFLRDLIPWRFCNPGPAAFRPRIGVSTSLGPKQRAIGMPTGLESMLPQQFNPKCLDLFGDRPGANREPNYVPIPQPFRGPYEDGVRDVRGLYHEKFVLHVDPWGRTKRPATECYGRPQSEGDTHPVDKERETSRHSEGV